MGKIPQAAAIFHNNCWYLSHHMLKLTDTFAETLGQNGLNLCVDYKDKVAIVRELSKQLRAPLAVVVWYFNER